jgi:hypothetical protein
LQIAPPEFFLRCGIALQHRRARFSTAIPDGHGEKVGRLRRHRNTREGERDGRSGEDFHVQHYGFPSEHSGSPMTMFCQLKAGIDR